MELESIFLGLLFSFGVFAVKGGAGLFYRLQRESGFARKTVVTSLYALTYLILFAGSGVVLKEWNLMRHFETFTLFLRSGHLIHIIIAVGLTVWGIYLLKGDSRSGEHSHAWLGLALPCPMCLIVLFVSISFLLSYFPEASVRVLAISYAAFLGLSLLSSATLTLWSRITGVRPASVLGTAMLIASAYFLVTACVMPHYQNLDRVYRLAVRYGNPETQSVAKPALAASLAAVFFVSGGIIKRFRMGRS